MAPLNRPHILVSKPADPVAYGPHPKKIDVDPVRAPDRAIHGARLKAALTQAASEAFLRRAAAAEVQVTQFVNPGIYVQFESPPNVDLNAESKKEPSHGP